MRPHLQKIALAHPPPAHILVDKNVAALLELVRRPKMLRILVFPVWTHTIRSAVHQKRIWPARRILRHIYRRKQPLAVPHGNAVLVLGVVCPNVVLGRSCGRGLLGVGNRKSKSKQKWRVRHGAAVIMGCKSLLAIQTIPTSRPSAAAASPIPCFVAFGHRAAANLHY